MSVKNWQTNTLTPVYQAGGSADWTSHTVAVGGDGTSKLSVLFQASAGDTTTAIWVSDISLNTGSTPGLNTGAYINGDFSQNLRNWHPFYGGWGVDGTVGHTAVPAAYTDNNPYDNRNRMISIPFIVTSGQTSWTIWSKSRSALYVDVQVLDGTGTWTSVLANAESCSDWCVRSFSLTNQLSQPVVLQVWPQGGWGALYIDDVCPAVGGLGWADPPTPTPGATATQGGGGGPYPTIDWSQFPTQAPYPTFPPFPTQAPLFARR